MITTKKNTLSTVQGNCTYFYLTCLIKFNRPLHNGPVHAAVTSNVPVYTTPHIPSQLGKMQKIKTITLT
jgi:hypothetical protein